MATKRLHYFDQQFLVEADFTDEQKYHLDMRRRLTRVLHTFGIAEGLTARRTGSREVTVDPGVAIDASGRELILEAAVPLNLGNLTTFPANTQVFVTIAYDEDPSDPATATGASGDTRITEAPLVQASTTAAPTDGSVIRLALFTKTAGGDVPGNLNDLLDGGVRQAVSAKNAAGAITDVNLANGAVTTSKITDGAVIDTKLGFNSVITAKIADSAITDIKIAANAVTLTKILDSAVGTAKIADLAVSTAKIADLGVSSAKLAANAVTTAKITDLNVTGAKLADLTITTGKLADLAITDPKIAAGTITEARLAPAVVTKLNTPAGLVSVGGVTNPGGDVGVAVSGALTVSADNSAAKRIVFGENHSTALGNVHGLTSANLSTIGALLASQYDLRLRRLDTIAFNNGDANGKQTPLSYAFTPRIVLAICTCGAVLGTRLYGGASYGFFDVTLGAFPANQRCTGFGITWNSNSDWFPRMNAPTVGICSATFFDGSIAPARSEDLSVTAVVSGITLTSTLNRTIVGAGNQALPNFTLTLNIFAMGQ